MGFGGSGGGSNSLSTSSDVALSNPANNEVLAYDTANSKWKNASVGGAGAILFVDMDDSEYNPPSTMPSGTKQIIFRGIAAPISANMQSGAMPNYVGTGTGKAPADYHYDPRFS